MSLKHIEAPLKDSVYPFTCLYLFKDSSPFPFVIPIPNSKSFSEHELLHEPWVAKEFIAGHWRLYLDSVRTSSISSHPLTDFDRSHLEKLIPELDSALLGKNEYKLIHGLYFPSTKYPHIRFFGTLMQDMASTLRSYLPNCYLSSLLMEEAEMPMLQFYMPAKPVGIPRTPSLSKTSVVMFEERELDNSQVSIITYNK